MLKSLSIKNVALISNAELEFGSGLNVLSGETGAGKSVVLEAINFALGQKADKSMITNGEDHCSVVCVFSIDGSDSVKKALQELEIDFDDEIVVKRTFCLDGRSSVKLNGETVNATMLRKVTSLMVDVHGQSDHFMLLKESNQLELVDRLGGDGIAAKKAEILACQEEMKAIDKSLSELGGSDEDRAKRLDYIEYCLNEIDGAALAAGEDEKLLSRKKVLINAEKIASAVNEAGEKLSGDGYAVDMATDAERALSSVSQYNDKLSECAERLSALIDELGEISALVKDAVDFDFDENELDEIENRLDVISRLKSKYGKTIDDVLLKRDEFIKEKDLLLGSEENAKKLLEKRAILNEKLSRYCEELTKKRKTVCDELSGKLSLKLKDLGMKNAVFGVEFEKSDRITSNGNDEVSFVFSANLGEAPKPLSKIISGGELSRLMLAIKTVTGSATVQSTYIFDEIDAGVSGNAAVTVAENFALIAASRQIIAVSHLPQIVAMADVSLLIKKREEGGRTHTEVITLDEEGKTEELVRLIGGLKSDAALNHAKELIVRAEAFKKTLS